MELCELDLGFCDGCSGAFGEDVKDEGGAVEYAAFEFFFEVAKLRG